MTIQKQFVIRDGRAFTAHLNRRQVMVDFRPASTQFRWSPAVRYDADDDCDCRPATTDSLRCTLEVVLRSSGGVKIADKVVPARFDRCYVYYPFGAPVHGPFEGGDFRTSVYATNIRCELERELCPLTGKVFLDSVGYAPDLQDFERQKAQFFAEKQRKQEAYLAQYGAQEQAHMEAMITRLAEMRGGPLWGALCLWSRGKKGAQDCAEWFRMRREHPLSDEAVAKLKAEVRRLRSLAKVS